MHYYCIQLCYFLYNLIFSRKMRHFAAEKFFFRPMKKREKTTLCTSQQESWWCLYPSLIFWVEKKALKRGKVEFLWHFFEFKDLEYCIPISSKKLSQTLWVLQVYFSFFWKRIKLVFHSSLKLQVHI